MQILSRTALCAALVLGAAAGARADIVGIGGGDPDAVPLYRALSFGTINFGGGILNGVDYNSNFAPLPMANGSTTIALNGATMTTVGAAAYSGFYAGRNYASISVSNANAADQYYQVAGQGTATSVQFFTPEAAAAYATFTWRVSGSTSNPSQVGNTTCSTPIPEPGCFPAATGRLDFGASTRADAVWSHLFFDPEDKLETITRFGPGTYTYRLPIEELGEVIRLFYWSSAYAQVNAGEAPAGSSFTLTADYYNTVVLEEVQLFDASDTPLSDWTMRDLTSGDDVFNQSGRLAAVLPAPPLPTPGTVPEPGAPALLALALFAAGLAGRRGRRGRRGQQAPQPQSAPHCLT